MRSMDFMAEYKATNWSNVRETEEEKRERISVKIRANRDRQIDNILAPTSEVSTNTKG